MGGLRDGLYDQKKIDWIEPNHPLPVSFFEEYSEEFKEVDSLVASIEESKSLNWTLDSLNPFQGNQDVLLDSLLRPMIYFSYSYRLASLEKPLVLRYVLGNRNLFIMDGIGNTDNGFIKVACLTDLGDAFEYGCPLDVFWFRTSDTLMDSTRVHEAFSRACEQGVLISRFNNPKWTKPSSLVRCAFLRCYRLQGAGTSRI